MKVMITGVAGFIGSNLAHWILAHTDHSIIGVDNLSTGFKENLPESDRFTFLACDVNSSYLHSIFRGYNPEVCFHLAAYAAEARSNRIRVFNHMNNTVGTANVINACINGKCKLVFTSSVAVYSGKPPFTESTNPFPIDEYGLSKYMSELSIQLAGDQQGLDWCIVRPRNVYGERQSLWDSARNVMGIWMNQVRNGQPMTIFGEGQQRRSFTYIGDILRPLFNAAFVSKEIINLGTGKSYTIREAAGFLMLITKFYRTTSLPARHEVDEATCAIDKSIQLLGFKDKTFIHDGLIKMWAWAEHQPKREQTPLPELEIV